MLEAVAEAGAVGRAKPKLAWTVDLFWIGYDGKETRYATLAPGDG